MWFILVQFWSAQRFFDRNHVVCAHLRSCAHPQLLALHPVPGPWQKVARGLVCFFEIDLKITFTIQVSFIEMHAHRRWLRNSSFLFLYTRLTKKQEAHGLYAELLWLNYIFYLFFVSAKFIFVSINVQLLWLLHSIGPSPLILYRSKLRSV